VTDTTRSRSSRARFSNVVSTVLSRVVHEDLDIAVSAVNRPVRRLCLVGVGNVGLDGDRVPAGVLDGVSFL
jgi:hypothetical protein